MTINPLIPLSAPQPKRRLRGTLYAATLLIGGGLIGTVVAGPALAQGPQGGGSDSPRWQHGWNDNQRGWNDNNQRQWIDNEDEDDDGWERGPTQLGFRMGRDGDGDYGMRERGMRQRGGGISEHDDHDDMRMGMRMGGRGHDGPRMGWRGERMDRGGFGGGMMFPGAIERRVNRLLGLVDASTEQRQKVRSILEAAGNDLYPLRQQRMENRRQIAAALAAATIDRAKIESLRQEQLKLNDTASKRFTDALTEAAEVLTPAQRAELAKRMEQRRRG